MIKYNDLQEAKTTNAAKRAQLSKVNNVLKSLMKEIDTLRKLDGSEHSGELDLNDQLTTMFKATKTLVDVVRKSNSVIPK